MRGHVRPARSEKGREGKAWVIVVEVPAEGGRRQKTSTFEGGRREAEKELTRLQRLADTQQLGADAKLTVQKYLETWLADYTRMRLSGQSPDTYHYAVGKLTEALGSHRLEKLTPVHIQRAYRGFLDAGLAPASVNLIAAVLHRGLKQAVRQRVLALNPCDALEPLSCPRSETKVLDKEQALALLAAAHADPDGLPVVLALGLGVRLGEAYGLQWADVDFGAGTIYVRRSLLPDRTFKAPKSGKGRTVSLPSFVRIALEEQRQAQEAVRRQVGEKWNPLDLVNPSPTGEPRYPATTRTMRRLCEEAGVPVVTFHGLRHSHASLLLADGEPLKAVQERLGHSSPTITLNIYAHILPGMQERTAARLDSLLGG